MTATISLAVGDGVILDLVTGPAADTGDMAGPGSEGSLLEEVRTIWLQLVGPAEAAGETASGTQLTVDTDFINFGLAALRRDPILS